MSTGFCMGASIAGIKLTTKWAVDLNASACDSLRHNHPETEVRNEAAEDFLVLLKEWKTLCEKFSLISSTEPIESISELEDEEGDEDDDTDETSIGTELSPGEFEVQEFTAIAFGDLNDKGEKSLHLRVRWKGYGPDEDTWEPYAGLGNCKDKLKEFVSNGFTSNLLPLPGTAYSVCGGPPCQGVSGYNRFRNKTAPLEDTKNQQLLVFLDIIDFLKPKYVLMENVVDLLKFSNGYLARHAVASLVAMNYQTRLGMMAAGSYGVPQLRNRVFLWAAQPTEKLPPYPLPTHEVLKKFNTPVEFEEIQVGRIQKENLKLDDALTLADAISDLPPVTNYETIDVRNYNEAGPTSDFQKYIALKRSETLLPVRGGDSSHMLFDHQPLQLSKNDLERISYIPKKKGANFRDMPGVLVHNNKVKIDSSVKRAKLTSGKNVVPRYAIKFVKGTSKKPFGRLWWDEIVNTVVTRAEPHNQCVIHPKQDRVLSVRENARLQGFPDSYKLCGTIKQKYIQMEADTVYYYRCGGEGPEFHLKTPPAQFPITFAVAGDLGQTGWTKSTLDHIDQCKYAVHLLPGDLSYADYMQHKWDTFGELVQPLASVRPWMVTQGNHEKENIPFIVDEFVSFNSRWKMPYEESGSNSNLYYSFEVAGVHAIMLGSYTDYDRYSDQYKWLKADLAKVDRERTPWLIVLFHVPWYNSNNAHQHEGDDMMAEMEPLLYASGVDIVFTGHVHAYERTKRVNNGKSDPCGPVHITIGDGGNREGLARKYKDPSPEWSVFREASFGHGELQMVNSTHALWTWHRNDDDEPTRSDEVWLNSLVNSGCLKKRHEELRKMLLEP